MRVDVPEYNTYVDFPDNLPPQKIEAELNRLFPPKQAVQAKPSSNFKQKVEKGSKIASSVAKGVESVATQLSPTALLAPIAGGYAGIAGLAVGAVKKLLGGKETALENALRWENKAQEAVSKVTIYQPKDPLAEKIASVPGKVFTAAVEGPEKLGRKITTPVLEKAVEKTMGVDAATAKQKVRDIRERRDAELTKAFDNIAAQVAPMAVAKKGGVPASKTAPKTGPKPAPKGQAAPKVTPRPTVQALSARIGALDPALKAHGEQVAGVAVKMAKKLGLSEELTHDIMYGAWLHDYGKLNIPKSIKEAPRKLKPGEQKKMQQHPVSGEVNTDYAGLSATVKNVIKHHHEKYDGTGYPSNLKGDSIPLEAQIVSAADVFDALTTKSRSYRKPMPPEELARTLESMRGSGFREDVLDALLEVTGIEKKVASTVKNDMAKASGPKLDAEALAILNEWDADFHAKPQVVEGAKANKVIFLDIDGVLNRGGAKGEAVSINPMNVANLNRLLDAHPDAKIVVSSTWRKGNTPESLEKILVDAGVREGRVIGKTGNLGGDNLVGDGRFEVPRGSEIDEWLRTYGKDTGTSKVIVFDDRYDLYPFQDRQIRPSSDTGLTYSEIEAADRILSNSKKNWGLPHDDVKVKGNGISPGPGAQARGINQAGPSITQLRNSLSEVPRVAATKRAEILKDSLGVFRNRADGYLGSLKAGSAAMWDAYSRPPISASFKGVLGDYLLSRTRFQTEGHSYAKTIKETIPDKTVREGMANWLEADGDVEILSQRSKATSDPYSKRGYEAAINLTEEQKLHAQNIRNYFDDMLDQAKEAGVLEDGVENYINHVWGNTRAGRKLAAEINSGLLGVNPSLLKKRIYESYFEGEQAGLVPKNKDIGFLVTAYDSSFKEMLAARTFMRQLVETNGRDGRPLAVVSGGGKTLPSNTQVPEKYIIRPKTKPEDAFDYRRVDHPALRKWKWVGNDPNGAPILIEGDLLLHPEIVATFAEKFSGKGYYSAQNLFGKSNIAQNPIGSLALRGLGEFKRTLLSLSGFHQVQVGVHAVFHNVNPVKAPRIDLYDPITTRGVRNGLMITDHSALAEFSEGVGGHNGLVARIPGLGPMMNKYQEYLFQDYIPRLKVAMFKEAYERNTKRYPQLTEDQIAEITAHQANAAFGELNYKWLGRNKTFQDSLRIFFLAPDFLEARFKFVAQALTPHGQEQLSALIRGTAELYFGARVMNMLLNDGDPKFDKPLSVTFDKKDYALRTIPGDLVHLFHDPRGFVYYRLNPGGVRPFVEWATGKDARGQERTAKLEVLDFIKSGIPIPIQGFIKNPEDSLVESLISSALQSLGINTYKAQTAAEKIASEAAGKNIPRTEVTEETRERAKLMKKLRKSLDEQPVGVPDEVRNAVLEGKITAQQAIRLLDERDLPPIARSFKRLSIRNNMDEIDKIFEAATPQEKAILRPIMKEKTMNWFASPNTTRADRDKYRDRLLPYLRGEK